MLNTDYNPDLFPHWIELEDPSSWLPPHGRPQHCLKLKVNERTRLPECENRNNLLSDKTLGSSDG